MDEQNSDSILVPAPTAWPFIAAFGITLILSGLITNVAVSAVGIATLLCAAIGWWRDVLPEQKEELLQLSVAERSAAGVSKSSRVVDHLAIGIGGHRARVPEKVHPYSAGFYGGLAGAGAMAIIATLFGLISHGSIWYPVNLLAAGIVPSLADASLSQLRQFSAAGLIAGAIIHLLTSLLVGLLYAISLPMFPRGAKWRSGMVTPVLWSGIVAATLSVINPTLNARIEWPWFVGSQIAFGLTAGWVIARTEKIETLQSWPLLERAGIEAQESDSEEKSDS
ncbi:MAG TPA: hypothetical protein VHZ55_10660 [Bryobacteraceae bacterium]|nr:hypothetical protein [Bryobacteraceae bacterium]